MPPSDSNDLGATQRIILELQHDVRGLHDDLGKQDSQFAAMVKGLDDLKEAVGRFTFLAESHKEAMSRAFIRIEKIETDVGTCKSEISQVKSELHGWINKAKGGWWIGSILWGAFGSLLVGACIWLTSEVMDMRDRLSRSDFMLTEMIKTMQEHKALANEFRQWQARQRDK